MSDLSTRISRSLRHSRLEDAQALLTGTLFAALGVALFKRAGMLSGGTVGLAFLGHYASGWPFGLLFFAINPPFYGLAWRRMGAAFTVKTVIAVLLMAALSEALPHWLGISAINPLFAALGGGLLIGRLRTGRGVGGRRLLLEGLPGGGLLAGPAIGLEPVLVLGLEFDGGVALLGELGDEIGAPVLGLGDRLHRVLRGGLRIGLGLLGLGGGGLLLDDLVVGDLLHGVGDGLQGLDVLDLDDGALPRPGQDDPGLGEVGERIARQERGEEVERVAGLLIGRHDDGAEPAAGGLGRGGGVDRVLLRRLRLSGGGVELVEGLEVVLIGRLGGDLSSVAVRAELGDLDLEVGYGRGGRLLLVLGLVDVVLGHLVRRGDRGQEARGHRQGRDGQGGVGDTAAPPRCQCPAHIVSIVVRRALRTDTSSPRTTLATFAARGNIYNSFHRNHSRPDGAPSTPSPHQRADPADL